MGVGYLGFIFAARSPRRISPGRAAEITGMLAGRARAVGVFAGEPVGEALLIAAEAGIGIVQLHGPYSESDVAAVRAAGLRAWLLDPGGMPPATSADGVILDGRAGDMLGGTGRMADWKRAEKLASRSVFTILAGGIGASNIRAAARTGCAVLDLNSSLETAPGVKSLPLLAEALSQLAV